MAGSANLRLACLFVCLYCLYAASRCEFSSGSELFALAIAKLYSKQCVQCIVGVPCHLARLVQTTTTLDDLCSFVFSFYPMPVNCWTSFVIVIAVVSGALYVMQKLFWAMHDMRESIGERILCNLT
mmetsp:Transcript_4729/g.11239  ORF Transcript_4729/g.11239 Transcript_4729/m.11239 type:complete len:126 (+) Transcript_4729:1642-2019(+)